MFRATRITAVTFIMIVFICFCCGALFGKGKPYKPPKDFPCDATSVKVHNNSFCGESIWIEVPDSDVTEDILCGPCTENSFEVCDVFPIVWIGGTVVVDASYEHGFYFDPTSIIVAEVTAEGYQTSICQIANSPGVFDGGTWYIPFLPIKIEEL